MPAVRVSTAESRSVVCSFIVSWSLVFCSLRGGGLVAPLLTEEGDAAALVWLHAGEFSLVSVTRWENPLPNPWGALSIADILPPFTFRV